MMEAMSVATMPLPFAKAFAVVEAKAQEILLQARTIEPVGLLDAAGRVLAEPLTADRDQPPFPRSTRDGFAARAEDWARGPLEIQGILPAGQAWQGGALAPGTCIEIMTGAPVPDEADSVAMIEHVWQSGTAVSLEPGRTISAGENIVPAGAEARAGGVLLAAGTRITAHGIAVAASCGYARVRVFRRPRVAILSTGDELVGVAETPLPQQIRNSNSQALAALVLGLGGEPRLFAPVPDQAAALEAAIAEALGGCDLLLLSGGVSMGKYDLVEPALAALGAEFEFTGARIQPGKPIVFGSLREGALPFFGLPGNPVSSIVCFALFVAPVLAALGGERGYRPPFVQALLGAAVQVKPGLTRFLPALLTHAIDGSMVEAIAWQGSGDLAATARANCFLVVPEDAAELKAGTTVTVLPA
jgi:molybdopterin molybdotransferase